MKRAVVLAALAMLAASASAETIDQPASPRFALRSAPTIEPAPATSQRFTMRARFAPDERAGELREGENFTLIGRFAKGAVICASGDAIFRNGFEQP